MGTFFIFSFFHLIFSLFFTSFLMLLSSGWLLDIWGKSGAREIPFIYLTLLYYAHGLITTYGHDIFVYTYKNYGAFMAGNGLSWLLHLFFFHSYGIISSLLDYYPNKLWSQYKTHRRDTKSYFSILPNVIANQLLYIVVSYIIFLVFRGRGMRKGPGLNLYMDSNFNIVEDYENAIIFPEFKQMVGMFVLFYIIYDFGFYFFHRLLHHPSLYQTYHKKHHTTFASIGITGLYCSSLDFVLTQAIPVIIPGLIFDFPIVIAWLGTIVGSLNSIHSHSCYTFPFLPTPLDHDAHHAKFNCWFATGPFDLLFGTTSQQIKKRREERMKME